MKRFVWIGFLFLTLLACHRAPESPGVPAAPQRPELVAIDTLMQSRPDSALAMLLAEPLDDPYYHLLLSEALYKNDSAQVNRPKLLAAMASFDSAAASPRSTSQQAFLAARGHYMNGVGYYEMDSVVRACEQYMTALEIMEERFSEKDLVGPKAKFMALTYTRLSQIFSDQYLHEQAILFARQSLPFYQRQSSSSWHLSRMLKEIGSQYDMMEMFDSAGLYYQKALAELSDTTGLLYRDIATVQAFLSYKEGENYQSVLKNLLRLSGQSESDWERTSRYAIIGELYYHEGLYDSAWRYLDQVFRESPIVASKKQSAELMAEICKLQEKETQLIEYAGFLVPFATQEENGSTLKSQLRVMYDEYRQGIIDKKQRQAVKKVTQTGILVVGAFFAVIFLVIARHKRIDQAHKVQQAAISGRLRRSNEALRISLEKIKEQERDLKKQDTGDKSDSFGKQDYEGFLCTEICREITEMVKKLNSDKHCPLKTNMDVAGYKAFALSTKQQALLLKTVEAKLPVFFESLKTRYPIIDRKGMLYCSLYLLNVDKLSICVLLQEPYATARRFVMKLENNFGCQKRLRDFLLEQARVI